jgi:AAA domain
VKLISAEERLTEVRGVSLLIAGPTGVGKTSLLKTLSPETLSSTLFVDIEAGDLPVAHLPIASVRPRTAQECMDLACAIGGPDPALPASSAYSQAHYASVSADPELMKLAHYKFIFVDSLTAVGRLFFRHSEQLPEAFTDRGKKDLRGVYGIFARNAVAWLNQWQQARGRTVVFVAKLRSAVAAKAQIPPHTASSTR